MLSKDKKKSIIESFRLSEKDTGSVEIQVALRSERIKELTEHFKTHKKDHHGRRGLLRLVSERRSLLDYLKRIDQNRYVNLIDRLSLRK